MNDRLDHVEHCIAHVREGGMLVLVDDEDRENEGDLVIAGEHCRAEHVNFMCIHGRGLVCLALAPERVDALRLPLMVPRGKDDMGTAFTVSIEASAGVTTGISAADRAETIRVASDPTSGPEAVVSPGHIFPLRAQAGGVLVRSGHTEGAVDLARLAGLAPAGVICEIMRDDGEMARMADLAAFAREHGLPVLTIADLIEYRLRRESLVEQVARAPFAAPRLGIGPDDGWSIASFRSTVQPTSYYLALIKGELSRSDEPVMVRAQRARVLGDVFGFAEDDSGGRLRAAIEQLSGADRGVLLYVLGHGLHDFDHALRVQAGDEAPAEREPGARPTEAGFRSYGLGAQVLRALGLHRVTLLTDHPRKIVGLEGFGIEVVGTLPLTGGG